MKEDFIHIPTPGDHYSAATGSAVMTIIYEITRQHALAGGRTRLVVARGTRHDYEIGSCVEVDYQRLANKKEKLIDTALGTLGLERPFATGLYAPFNRAIPADFQGVIFVWNNPGPLKSIRKAHPGATLCLYAQNWLFKTYTRREARQIEDTVDRVISCSEFTSNQLKELLGRPTEKLLGLVNGVDTEKFAPIEKPAISVPTILFVGRVQPYKGPHLILEAANKMAARTRNFKVRIVGSSGFDAKDKMTPYELSLRELAKPIADIVEFQHFVDRQGVLAEYRNADIACVPSTWDEPCSLTVPESMACGLPTIASRRGGIPEVGGNGVLYFDPNNVDELVNHMMLLIESPEQRTLWQERGRMRAEEISWQNHYAKLTDFLRK